MLSAAFGAVYYRYHQVIEELKSLTWADQTVIGLMVAFALGALVLFARLLWIKRAGLKTQPIEATDGTKGASGGFVKTLISVLS